MKTYIRLSTSVLSRDWGINITDVIKADSLDEALAKWDYDPFNYTSVEESLTEEEREILEPLTEEEKEPYIERWKRERCKRFFTTPQFEYVGTHSTHHGYIVIVEVGKIVKQFPPSEGRENTFTT